MMGNMELYALLNRVLFKYKMCYSKQQRLQTREIQRK
jgi:hypothetical protein